MKHKTILLACFAWVGLHAMPVGELHRSTTTPTAALRDSGHSAAVAITVWYPAAAGVAETPLTIGPQGRPLFLSGKAASDAPLAQGTFPIVMLSHGFGGTARMMGWFGTALAQSGIVVVAVDHPGNNGMAPMTLAASVMAWDRAEDLKAAFATVTGDPYIGPHVDANRLGVAGFSAGGFTALVAAGARVDVNQFVAFCKAHPGDGVCRPQVETPDLTMEKAMHAFDDPALEAERRHAGDDHALPHVRAVFVMAPAIVQGLTTKSLGRLNLPVVIVLGGADTVAPPATNGDVAARWLGHARLTALPGVGHYDFLAECTANGKAALPMCRTAVPQAGTHALAIEAATALFAKTL